MVSPDRALLLAGGSHGHDFAATASALANALDRFDLEVDVVDEPDAAWAALIGSEVPYSLFVVNGLRFRMQHPRYDELRERWAYTTPPAADAAMDRHLGLGRPVLCVHTGCICFDDWDRWSAILGRQWSWDEQHLSWHPERGPLTIEPAPGLGAPFEIVDEVYTDMVERGDVDVLARCAGQPVMWRLEHGTCKVGVTTVGHGPDTYANTRYLALFDELVRWLVT